MITKPIAAPIICRPKFLLKIVYLNLENKHTGKSSGNYMQINMPESAVGDCNELIEILSQNGSLLLSTPHFHSKQPITFSTYKIAKVDP